MGQPLAAYWIEASHNTYLEAGQLYGPSSTAPYLTALSKGCRCHELDVWDGPGGAPSVYHGRTLTTAVPFEDVVRALRAYAFKGRLERQYPLILSLEMHASASQQQRAADILADCFGERLLYYRGEGEGGEGGGAAPALPSPLELRGRVIIKSKLSGAPSGSGSGSGSARELVGGTASSSSSSSSRSTSSRTPLAPSLLSMLYLRGVPWRQLLAPVAAAAPGCAADSTQGAGGGAGEAVCALSVHAMASLKDGKLEAILQKQRAAAAAGSSSAGSSAPSPVPALAAGAGAGASAAATSPASAAAATLDVAALTRTHLIRVYPGLLHYDSSNFIPCQFWAAGVQMTALNYQTQDVALRLQRAWFKQNGRCGYVLKPAYLRGSPEASAAGKSAAAAAAAAFSPAAAAAGAADCEGKAGGAVEAEEQPALSPLPTPPPTQPVEDSQPQLLLSIPRNDSLKSLVSHYRETTPHPSQGSSSAPPCLLFSPQELDAPPSSSRRASVVLTFLGAQNLPCPAAAAAAAAAGGGGGGVGGAPAPPQWLQWTVHLYGDPGDEFKAKLPPIAASSDACVWASSSSGSEGSALGQQLVIPVTSPAVASLYIEVHGYAEVAAAGGSSGAGGAGAGAGGGLSVRGSGTFLAYAALPLPAARGGYRGLQLREASGKKLPLCTLLCRLTRS